MIFAIRIQKRGRTQDYTALGTDDVEFMISTNPGEPVKPLGKVASGGELSRIMLAIKTVMAESDDIAVGNQRSGFGFERGHHHSAAAAKRRRFCNAVEIHGADDKVHGVKCFPVRMIAA